MSPDRPVDDCERAAREWIAGLGSSMIRSNRDGDIVIEATEMIPSLAALLREQRAAEREACAREACAREVRTAFDAAFTLGIAFGCGLTGDEEAIAAKRGARVPTAALCDKFWADWQSGRSRTTESPT